MKKLIFIVSLLIGLTAIAISQDSKRQQCKGTTTKNVQCNNRQVGEYCHYHDPAKPKCGDPDINGKRQLTSKGQPCKNSVKEKGQKCWRHE